MTEKPATEDNIRSGSDVSLNQYADVIGAVLTVCIERDDVFRVATQSVLNACLQRGALSKIDRMMEYGCARTKRCCSGLVVRTIVDHDDGLIESTEIGHDVTYDVVFVEGRYYDPQMNE